MSYSIITAVLLAAVALSSSAPPPDYEQNAFARFYPDFAQLYRPATTKPYPSNSDRQQSLEHFQFLFTEKEYSQISEESITMLYTNVTERTITYHPIPNFEVAGTRYLYRPDPTENTFVEIELVNSEDRLFREVQLADRYFYLPSFDGLQYVKRAPLMPFYEVAFMCNSSFPSDNQDQSPVLSYIDKSFQWTPRYLLDLSMFGNDNQSLMYAYADIRNNGEQTIVLKGVEFIAGDITVPEQSTIDLSDENVSTNGSVSAIRTNLLRPLEELVSNTYVYQVSLPSSIKIPPRSLKSLKFLETNIKVTSFLSYVSAFSPVNSTGKFFNTYNITCLNDYLPAGLLLLRKDGRFIGEINVPNLTFGDTFTTMLGYNPDFLYHRQVTVAEDSANSTYVTYNVKYTVENLKSTGDVRLRFIDSFSSFNDVNISVPDEDAESMPYAVLDGDETVGFRDYYTILPQRRQKLMSYQVSILKS